MDTFWDGSMAEASSFSILACRLYRDLAEYYLCIYTTLSMV
ncbi:hypothetical protein DSUL_50039 [Desulfovibrionales bacterium]